MNLNLSLREIEYVLAVYQENSFTAAAEKLYISQPSLSQAVKKVEENLGYTVFIRSKKGLRLSEEGRCFVEACMRIRKNMKDCETEINDLNTLNSGRLAIGMPFHLGEFVAPPTVSAFRKRYPGVELSLIEQNSSELETSLQRGEIDIAAMPLPLNDPSLNFVPLQTGSLFVVMSADDPHCRFVYMDEKGQECIDLRDLEDASFIVGQPGQRIRKVAEMLLDQEGIKPDILVSSRSIKTIISLASVGMGVAIAPDLYIPKDGPVHEKKVCRISSARDYPWIIGAAYAGDAYLSNAARQFLSVMTDIVPKLRLS